MLYCFFKPQEIAIDYLYGEGIGLSSEFSQFLDKISVRILLDVLFLAFGFLTRLFVP